MGEKFSSNWRVITAALFSVTLVVGAYVLARGIESPRTAEASTEAALLQAIATRDSTGDGLPDWQKALYGIPLDAMTTDYFNLGMTDGEAVARGLIVPKAVADINIATSSNQSIVVDPALPPAPDAGTLTDAFAKNFFTLYVKAKQANGGTVLSPAQVEDLAAESLNTLSSMIVAAPDYKSAGDLAVSGSGAEALKAFAASAEAVILKNKKESDATKSEILYLQDVVQNGDASAFPRLIALAKMYRDSAVGLAALSVPAELAADGLALINLMMRSSQITSDFARVNTDPLAAMLALEQYAQVSQSVAETLASMSNIYTVANIALPASTQGATFLASLAHYRTAMSSTQAL